MIISILRVVVSISLFGAADMSTAQDAQEDLPSTGLLLFKEAPARFFSEEDWRLVNQAVRRTLEKVPDGKTSSWENSATGSYGVIKPTRTYHDMGMTCRTLEILNHAAGRTGQENLFDFCKRGAGTWELTSWVLNIR
jgi:surface antigen